MNPLVLAARHGRWVLVLGLAVGILVPALAQVMRPLVPQMVVVLLFLAALRLNPADVTQSIRSFPKVAGIVLVLQLLLPLTIAGVGLLVDAGGSPFLVALVLMAAAPSISGSPNMVVMLNHPPIHALRIMVTGTALLPLTVLPVFWVLPALGQVGDIVIVALKLFSAIALTTTLALLVRKFLLPGPKTSTLQALDGLSAIVLAVFVVGLMPAVSETFLAAPQTAWLWLGVAFLANFGLQFIGFALTKSRTSSAASVSISLISGNRNIALFLVALPEQVIAPIMIFIGCYQIPMYLTPLLMQQVYRKR